ncbi:MAG TPA: hypothetical protein DCY94_00700 [Firmicutes bacterium]|nr:hypothetical protein [Bacillota bacterium]
MEKKIDVNTIERLVMSYYRKYEEKEVFLKVSIGRVRTVVGANPRPNSFALQFELLEYVPDKISDEMKVVPHFISDDEFARAVSTSLEDEGFIVDELSYDTESIEGGIAFTGITVHGEEKEISQGKEK